MTDLISKDYKAPVAVEKLAVADVKSKIIAFVGKGKKSYEDIVKHIQTTDNLTNDEVIAQAKAVHAEWYKCDVCGFYPCKCCSKCNAYPCKCPKPEVEEIILPK